MEEIKCESCSKEPTKRINVARFISKIDELLSTDDLVGAGELIEYWEKEALAVGDDAGRLSVVNEGLGLYRRSGNKGKGMRAVDEALVLLEKTGQGNNASGAVILVNAATTSKAFGELEKAFGLYERAGELYSRLGKTEGFEYAAFLNNYAAALEEAKSYSLAEEKYSAAIEILKKIGGKKGEIAVTKVNLAHLYYDRDESSQLKVEALLDEAWEYINAETVRDANYAFILSKCAPSFKYFKREEQAEAMLLVASEIYGKRV